MSYIGQEPGQGQAERFIYTATGSGTVVSNDDDGRAVGYTLHQVSVYLNGVKQVIPTDVAASDGSTVVFASAYASGDVIEIIALSAFSPANTVPKTGGTFSGNVTAPSLILTPSSAPSSPSEGQMYYNSTTDVVSVYNGSTWDQISNVTFNATGGTITTYGSYKVHTFTTSGTFTPNISGTVDYLVVAGGAAGGDSNTNSGGGGGAGGFRTAAGFSVTAQAYTITVGGGGTAGTNVRGASGVNSSIGSAIVSIGGGGGGAQTVNAAGVDGGSGGGGSYATGAGGAGESGQGNAGGNVNANGGSEAAGGGGGGAGGVGEVGSQAGDAAAQAGNGGVGEDQVMGLNANDSFTLLTNASAGHLDNGARYFAGGGAGEAYSLGVADGGVGGGGASAVAGTDFTGGGGGGGSNGGTNRTAGSGGSGIVIIRYAI
jgi:hypothetical protein